MHIKTTIGAQVREEEGWGHLAGLPWALNPEPDPSDSVSRSQVVICVTLQLQTQNSSQTAVLSSSVLSAASGG